MPSSWYVFQIAFNTNRASPARQNLRKIRFYWVRLCWSDVVKVVLQIQWFVVKAHLPLARDTSTNFMPAATPGADRKTININAVVTTFPCTMSASAMIAVEILRHVLASSVLYLYEDVRTGHALRHTFRISRWTELTGHVKSLRRSSKLVATINGKRGVCMLPPSPLTTGPWSAAKRGPTLSKLQQIIASGPTCVRYLLCPRRRYCKAVVYLICWYLIYFMYISRNSSDRVVASVDV